MKLNLTTNNTSEELVLKYLEENASEELANKINNGVQITKDDKTLISKKTLSGFMKYANDEAKKTVTKGATYACVRDEEVFSWAIHYFEESEILGELYNLDGTKYEAPKTTTKKKETKPEIVKPKEPAIKQLTLFDLLDMESTPKQAKVIEEPKVDEDIKPNETTDIVVEDTLYPMPTLEPIYPDEEPNQPNVGEDNSTIQENINDSNSNVAIEIVDDDGVITDISPAPSNVDDSILSLFNM